MFTGLLDPPLSPLGIDEALSVGHFLRAKDYTFTHAYTSPLQRASTSLALLLSTLNQHPHPPIIVTPALNERDYGDLNGRDKDAVAVEYGAELCNAWRRGYRAVPPHGESLEMTVERVWSYYLAEIQPRLMRGERVLIVSHGNTLRALVMKLDGLGEDEVMKVELGTAATRVYRLGEGGEVKDKEVFAVDGVEGGWTR
jgi:2,3-bisphosphoglycerate-dependent phosphoglycerate mutase